MHLPSLRHLNLRSNKLGLGGAKALAAVSWPSLSLLDLSDNQLKE
jgi:hypothetical protein